MIDPLALARQLESFSDPSDPAARKSQELTLQLLRHTPAPFSRAQFGPGHVTTTGLVLHPEFNAVLLIHHRRLERWLLPGGHVEPEDASVLDAARREVREETGILLPGAGLLAGIDVHGIPPNKREPLHYHHDLIFAFRADSPALVVQGEEVREARWFDVHTLKQTVPDLPGNIELSVFRALKTLPLPVSASKHSS